MEKSYILNGLDVIKKSCLTNDTRNVTARTDDDSDINNAKVEAVGVEMENLVDSVVEIILRRYINRLEGCEDVHKDSDIHRAFMESSNISEETTRILFFQANVGPKEAKVRIMVKIDYNNYLVETAAIVKTVIVNKDRLKDVLISGILDSENVRVIDNVVCIFHYVEINGLMEGSKVRHDF